MHFHRASGSGLHPGEQVSEVYYHGQRNGQVPPVHTGNRPDVLGQSLVTLGVLKELELLDSA